MEHILSYRRARGAANGLWWLVLLSTVGGILLLAQFWFGKPLTLEYFYKRVFLQEFLSDPESMTRLRVLEASGFWFHQDDLTDRSIEALGLAKRRNERNLGALDRYSVAGFTNAQKESRNVVQAMLLRQKFDLENNHFRSLVNPVNGPHLSLFTLLLNSQPLRKPDDIRLYVARLSKIPEQLKHVENRISRQIQVNVMPHRFAVEEVLAQLRVINAYTVENHPVFTHLQQAMKNMEGLSVSLSGVLLDDVRHELEASILPAFAEHARFISSLNVTGLDNRGISSSPAGAEYYKEVISRYTDKSTDIDKLIDSISSDLKRTESELSRRLNDFEPFNASVGARLRELRIQAANTVSVAKDRHAHVLERYSDESASFLISEIPTAVSYKPQVRELKSIVSTPYQSNVLLVRIDMTNPDLLDADLPVDQVVPTWNPVDGYLSPELKALSAENLSPGRALQANVQISNFDLPSLRRYAGLSEFGYFPSYIEGWKLYSLDLLIEASELRTPVTDGQASSAAVVLQQTALLQQQLMHFVRATIDLGLNSRGWNRTQAIAYVEGITGVDEFRAEREVNLVLLHPGNALAGVIGARVIHELANEARERLGKNFVRKEFHRTVLEGGPMPMSLLGVRVRNWVSSIQSSGNQ